MKKITVTEEFLILRKIAERFLKEFCDKKSVKVKPTKK